MYIISGSNFPKWNRVESKRTWLVLINAQLNIRSSMLSSKRACLTSSFECEPILNEDSRPVPHLEDVVTSYSDNSTSPSGVEELLATFSAGPDLRMSCWS